MNINIKLCDERATMPTCACDGDGGFDLTCIDVQRVEHDVDGVQYIYDTGVAIEIPRGYVGLLFPRSSVARTSLRLANSVGVIDSGYRGTIKFVYDVDDSFASSIDDNDVFHINTYDIGERVGQLVIVPIARDVVMNVVDTLSSSERGTGAFGHTGR